jgi:hypothetical protein
MPYEYRHHLVVCFAGPEMGVRGLLVSHRASTPVWASEPFPPWFPTVGRVVTPALWAVHIGKWVVVFTTTCCSRKACEPTPTTDAVPQWLMVEPSQLIPPHTPACETRDCDQLFLWEICFNLIRNWKPSMLNWHPLPPRRTTQSPLPSHPLLDREVNVHSLTLDRSQLILWLPHGDCLTWWMYSCLV